MPVRLELIVRALFAPRISVCIEPPDGMRLAGRMVSKLDIASPHAFLSQFQELFPRLKTALSSVLLRNDKEVVERLIHFYSEALRAPLPAKFREAS